MTQNPHSPPRPAASAGRGDTEVQPPATVLDTPTGPVTDMRELFDLAFQRQASDIHLTEHTPPVFRIHGDL
ncbi:MAG: hypothetical protein Q8R78_06240, partial [Candidatus Omnitrophota bacterium]|nr:hypothetical protein [Candidatus Omnitrophota bacterium]